MALFPDLPTTMALKYGVSLSGFQEESTLVKLDGLATGVAGARNEIDSLLTQFQKSIVAPKIPLSANLLTSAKKRFKNERIAACLLPSQGRSDVAICSFSPEDHERAVKIMCKPSVKHVPFQPHPSLRALPLEETATELSVIVEVNEAAQKIYVRGFVHEDVVSAQEKISSLVQATLVQFSPIVCTPEQMLYLRSKLRSPNEATQHALDALPAKVISERNRPLHFRGSPMDIESAQTQIIEGPLLQGLKHHSKTFKAHPKSYYQIEEHILRPVKEKHPDFVYDKRDNEGSGKESSTRRRGPTKAEESSFTVTVLSQDSVVLDEVFSQLEAVSPCVKTLNIKYRNELPCVQEKKEVTEKQYRVRIVIKADSSTVLIFGLTEGETRQGLNDLREHIDSTITVQKFIKLDRNQSRYMQQKKSDDWQDLKSDCTSFELIDKRRQETDTVLIRVEGTVQQVKAVEQGLAEMMGGNYFVKTFKLEVQKRHNRMWLKHWKAKIKEKEESHDFIITFTRKEMTEISEENKSVEYEFTMCGCEEDGTNEVEEEIRRQQMTDKIIELSPEATKALYTGMTEKQLHVSDQYTVNMFIDTRRNRVVLNAPEECGDDLESAEEEIHKFVGNRTTMEKEIPIDDPVIGVILRSKAKSLSHLAYANRLSKPLGVTVQCLRRPRCGLLLRGSQDAILKVEPLVHTRVISQIQSTVDEIKIPVDPLLLPFFSTTEFAHFKSKLQEDLCVVGTFPTLKKPNQVIKSVYLQTTSSACCIKLDICNGCMVNEEVDAIVNAANENLHHTGGLARAILNAGGDAIQRESTQHIQAHGKLKTGSVVCLGAGNLSCKKVIHAVGPRWVDGSCGEEQALYFTVLATIQTAQEEGFESVALPALSTGIFGMPEDVCVRTSIKAVRDFCQTNPNSCITNVRFVLLQDSLAEKFAAALDSDILLGSIMQGKQASETSTAKTHYIWEWMDDNRSFTPYSLDLNSMLNDQYKHNPHGSVTFMTKNSSYLIDFATMVQTNVITNFQREVKRILAASASAPAAQSCILWQFHNDQGKLTPYTPPDCQAIELMYQNRTPLPLMIKGRPYTFDFVQMCQVNVATSYKRPIVRSTSSERGVTGRDELSDTPDQSPETMRKKAVVTLRGPQANLPLAKSKLDDKLKNALKSNDILFPATMEGQILRMVQRHKISFTIRNADQTDQKGRKRPTKVLTIKGLSHLVHKATSAVQEEIISYQTAAPEESGVEVPPDWQPQTQNLELFAITRGSLEWNKVESHFNTTLPSVAVLQITRLQNKWLWERYAQHKRRLEYKNSGNVNERELFHGTRNNDPRVIYEGEDGFDMRYSAQGMWGLANYFAVKASYSHSYAYAKSDGSRQMFLVKVLTGDSYSSAPNHHLRMPPEKQSGAGGKLQFATPRYDTVTGNTAGSQVFMAYDNDKAYPAYLIQYK